MSPGCRCVIIWGRLLCSSSCSKIFVKLTKTFHISHLLPVLLGLFESLVGTDDDDDEDVAEGWDWLLLDPAEDELVFSLTFAPNKEILLQAHGSETLSYQFEAD